MATHFDEHEVGKFPGNFVIYAVAEWVLIILLFLDGFLAFAATELAKLFELKIPCFLCSRIDHFLVQRNSDFYYNDSICESHKKEVSSLAFCHNHRKLSDIRKMCENCLLSFATEKESHIDTYKSLVGILHKDLECFVETDQRVQPSLRDDGMHVERSSSERCSCCKAPLKVKSNNSKGKNSEMFTQAPTPSPRAYPLVRNEESRYSEVGEAEDGFNVNNQETKLTEDFRAAAVPLLTETDEEGRSPTFTKGNRLLGFSFNDSIANSPRFSLRINRKSPLEKTELASDSNDGNSVTNEVVDDSIFYHLNRQVGLDRKSLVALYMELDEERSAAAVAANNAMAMITRLQAEKAAVQMEALQYQRMMEEQAEYDEEALQATNETLIKREEEIKVLESELQIYRGKYGRLADHAFNEGKYEADMDYQEFKSPLKLNEDEDNQEQSLNHQLVSSQMDLDGRNYLAKNVFHSRESSYASVEAGNMVDMVGREGEACLSVELFSLNERLKALEADSELLELVGKEYEPDSEETRLLTQVSQNLEKLRHHVMGTFEGENA